VNNTSASSRARYLSSMRLFLMFSMVLGQF
jgi:hypothetical protein